MTTIYTYTTTIQINNMSTMRTVLTFAVSLRGSIVDHIEKTTINQKYKNNNKPKIQ